MTPAPATSSPPPVLPRRPRARASPSSRPRRRGPRATAPLPPRRPSREESRSAPGRGGARRARRPRSRRGPRRGSAGRRPRPSPATPRAAPSRARTPPTAPRPPTASPRRASGRPRAPAERTCGRTARGGRPGRGRARARPRPRRTSRWRSLGDLAIDRGDHAVRGPASWPGAAPKARRSPARRRGGGGRSSVRVLQSPAPKSTAGQTEPVGGPARRASTGCPAAVLPWSEAGSVAASLSTRRSPARRSVARSRCAPSVIAPRAGIHAEEPRDGDGSRRSRAGLIASSRWGPRGARRSGGMRLPSSIGHGRARRPRASRGSLGSASGIASACIRVSISPGSTPRKRTPVPSSSAGPRAHQVVDRRLGDAVAAPARVRGDGGVGARVDDEPAPPQEHRTDQGRLREAETGPTRFTSSTRAGRSPRRTCHRERRERAGPRGRSRRGRRRRPRRGGPRRLLRCGALSVLSPTSPGDRVRLAARAARPTLARRPPSRALRPPATSATRPSTGELERPSAAPSPRLPPVITMPLPRVPIRVRLLSSPGRRMDPARQSLAPFGQSVGAKG